MKKLVNFVKAACWWVIFWALVGFCFLLSSCSSCIYISAYQMQLEDGSRSGKHEYGEAVKKCSIRGAEKNDSTIIQDYDGAKLIMWYSKR